LLLTTVIIPFNIFIQLDKTHTWTIWIDLHNKKCNLIFTAFITRMLFRVVFNPERGALNIILAIGPVASEYRRLSLPTAEGGCTTTLEVGDERRLYWQAIAPGSLPCDRQLTLFDTDTDVPVLVVLSTLYCYWEIS